MEAGKLLHIVTRKLHRFDLPTKEEIKESMKSYKSYAEVDIPVSRKVIQGKPVYVDPLCDEPVVRIPVSFIGVDGEGWEATSKDNEITLTNRQGERVHIVFPTVMDRINSEGILVHVPPPPKSFVKRVVAIVAILGIAYKVIKSVRTDHQVSTPPVETT